MQEGPRPPDYMIAQEEILEDPERETQIQPKEKLEEVNLGADSRSPKPVFINSQLLVKERGQLVELIKKYVDVFAQTYNEMPSLDSGLVVHSLNVDLGTKLVIQPAKIFHTEIDDQITQEVKKLLAVGFIKPIQHP